MLAAEGGRINCSTTRTVTLRIRQDRPWWPDRTLATSAPKTGTNVFLVVREHCTGNSDMKVFAEVLTNTGGKMQSGLACSSTADRAEKASVQADAFLRGVFSAPLRRDESGDVCRVEVFVDPRDAITIDHCNDAGGKLDCIAVRTGRA